MDWSIWDKKKRKKLVDDWRNFLILFYGEKNGEEEELGWVSSLFFFFGDIVSQRVTRNWRNIWDSRWLLSSLISDGR